MTQKPNISNLNSNIMCKYRNNFIPICQLEGTKWQFRSLAWIYFNGGERSSFLKQRYFYRNILLGLIFDIIFTISTVKRISRQLYINPFKIDMSKNKSLVPLKRRPSFCLCENSRQLYLCQTILKDKIG